MRMFPVWNHLNLCNFQEVLVSPEIRDFPIRCIIQYPVPPQFCERLLERGLCPHLAAVICTSDVLKEDNHQNFPNLLCTQMGLPDPKREIKSKLSFPSWQLHYQAGAPNGTERLDLGTQQEGKERNRTSTEDGQNYCFPP